MMKFRETFVRKSKVTSTKGFTSPAKPAPPKNNKLGNFIKEDKKKAKPEGAKPKDEESVFELGDAHFGAFGDMQEEEDAEIEEISLNDDDDDDEASENSEFSERTVDEEEYELYMKTITIHKIQDFEEWRHSEHFPQHLFDSDDDDDDDDEYDEITVDSDEFQQSLSNGGMVIDWTGTRITLDSFGEKEVEKKKKKKKKKKTTKIKVKKKSKKSSRQSGSGTKSDKKKRKSEKRDKSTKSSPGSSQAHRRSSLNAKLTKEASTAKLESSSSTKISTDEDSSKASSLLEKEGTKRRSSKERSKRRSSKVSLNGSNDSLSLADLNPPCLNGLSTPISSPAHTRTVRKRPKGTKPSRQSSKSSNAPELSDDTGSMNSSFDIPESMRVLDGGGKGNFPQSADNLKSPKSPKSPRSPHAARSSPAGRRGGRRSSSKPNLWADGMAALSKPELDKNASTATADSGEAISRRSSSRISSTHSPKKRRPSADSTAAGEAIPRRSSSRISLTHSPKPRRPSADSTAAGETIPKRSSSRRSATQSPKPRRLSVDVSLIPRQSISNSSSPISRRSNSRRRIPKVNSRRQDLDINSEHIDNGRRRSDGRTMSNERKRTNSLTELEGLQAARNQFPNLPLDDSERFVKDNSNGQPEKRKSERLLNIERMAREGAAQRSNSIGALEKRKGNHAALKEKLAKSGKNKSSRTMKDKDGEGADGMKHPKRSSSLDSSKTKERRRGDKSEGKSKRRSTSTSGLSPERPSTMRSASVGAIAESRRPIRFGKKRESQVARSDSMSSQEASKTSFDPFGVAVDMQNGSSTTTSFADTSDRMDNNASERSQRSAIGLIKKPSTRHQDDLRVSNHGKGPVSLMTPRSMGRKKMSQRRSGNSSLNRSSSHGVNPATGDTGIGSKEVTW